MSERRIVKGKRNSGELKVINYEVKGISNFNMLSDFHSSFFEILVGHTSILHLHSYSSNHKMEILYGACAYHACMCFYHYLCVNKVSIQKWDKHKAVSAYRFLMKRDPPPYPPILHLYHVVVCRCSKVSRTMAYS